MHPLAQGVLDGDVRALARLLRQIDDRVGSFAEALAQLYPHTGRATVVGITGNPGAGKSTLVDQLIAHYRAKDLRVGVVAVDPTSPFTGGAILGDRIRMQRHALDMQVFVRSLATRGHLGGISRSTADTVHALDAWGANVVLVETVGVGQDELEVARIAATTVVVVPPGLGDEIQAIKAGILEIADVFCVNKADRDGADATVRDLEAMIGMGHEILHASIRSGKHHGAHRVDLKAAAAQLGETEWLPPIVKTVAHRNEGVADLAAAIERHRAFLLNTPRGEALRRERVRDEILGLLHAEILERVREESATDFDAAVDAILAHTTDPYTVAREALARFRQRERG